MQQITSAELKARLDAGEAIHLLDVREPDEVSEFNIGGTALPLGQLLSQQTEAIDDWKEDEVVVLCRSGKRSMQATMMLETMGFSNVKNLTGGLVDWQKDFGSAGR